MTVQAQVDPEQAETDFRKQVQSTLRAFIPGEWKIQNITRQKGNQFEAVTVQAIVRVADNENHQLEARAAKVSKIGFELYYPRAEYELTFDEIQAINAELRLDLIQKALCECNSYNAAFKKAGYRPQAVYRVSSTRFDTGNQTSISNNSRPLMAMMASGGTATGAVTAGMGGSVNSVNTLGYAPEAPQQEDDGIEEMGVSTRFSMVGTFVMRAVNND